MAFVAHRATGVHRIPDDWLDGFAPNGFRRATAREVAAWHEERGLAPATEAGAYCPGCLRRVPAAQTERRVQREPTASGSVEVWLYHCSACGTTLAADVRETDGNGTDAAA